MNKFYHKNRLLHPHLSDVRRKHRLARFRIRGANDVRQAAVRDLPRPRLAPVSTVADAAEAASGVEEGTLVLAWQQADHGP